MTRSASKHKNKHHTKEPGGSSRLFLTAAKAAVISLFFSFLLASLISGILMKLSDPLTAVFPSAMAVLSLSSLLAGYLCMKKVQKGVLACGILSGVFFMLLYTGISLFLPSEFSSSGSPWLLILLRVLIVLFSILGAWWKKSTLRKIRKVRK